MNFVDVGEKWTGRTAALLQAALRLSNVSFASRLGIATRTVANWHAFPDRVPNSEMQEVLSTALERAPADVQRRFGAALRRVADLDSVTERTPSGLTPDTPAGVQRTRGADLQSSEARSAIWSLRTPADRASAGRCGSLFEVRPGCARQSRGSFRRSRLGSSREWRARGQSRVCVSRCAWERSLIGVMTQVRRNCRAAKWSASATGSSSDRR